MRRYISAGLLHISMGSAIFVTVLMRLLCMDKTSTSPLLHLQRQQLLLRMEYEFEKEEFKRQTETMGVGRKVKRGMCWYPLRLGRSYYNALNQLVIDCFLKVRNYK